MEWQDIESAPAVGKKRLLFCNARKRLTLVGYREAGSRCCIATGYGRVPVTHWMPLPPPPETTP